MHSVFAYELILKPIQFINLTTKFCPQTKAKKYYSKTKTNKVLVAIHKHPSMYVNQTSPQIVILQHRVFHRRASSIVTRDSPPPISTQRFQLPSPDGGTPTHMLNASTQSAGLCFRPFSLSLLFVATKLECFCVMFSDSHCILLEKQVNVLQSLLCNDGEFLKI